MPDNLNVARISIGGLPLAVIDRRDSAQRMVATALARRGRGEPPPIVTSANGQVLSMCARDPQLRALFLAADLIHADGTPLVFASRLRGRTPLPERVATTDLFHVLKNLRARGFTHIRLPVTAERVMEAFSSADDVARQLVELDQALAILIDLGFAVSLDLHPGERLGRLHVAEPERAFELIDALWRSLARRYANRPPERLFFEVLNEPKVRAGVWNAQAARLVATIRREAPGHTVIYGPANYQRIDALLELAPLADQKIVYAVHFYDPMIFTHQGLDWSDDPLRYLQGIPFPARADDPGIARLVDILLLQGRGNAAALVRKQLSAPWTEERIAAEIARAGAWSERHRRPVIVNEFGVLGWKVAAADRARWLRTVVSAAERHCLGWTHWDYADGFGFVRRVGAREIPDEAIVDALLGSRVTPPR